MSKTLLFQGDSITDCGRYTCGGAGYPMYDLGPGYAGIIATTLLGEQPEKDWKIINRGYSGHRIVDLYARWKHDAININPDILSMLIGINDVGHEFAHKNGVDEERFDAFYRMLLDWSKENNPNIKFVIMQPFVYGFGIANSDWEPIVAKRGEIVRKIAQDYNAVYIPLQEIFDEALKIAPKEYWVVDGIHPTMAGHHLIVKAWLEATKDIL